MSGQITQLVHLAREGDRSALDRLMPLIYDELRATARGHLHGERPGHTLDTSALVNETYLRLTEQDRAAWRNRAHFLAVASMIMRRVLVNHAKQRNRLKRGGGLESVTLGQASQAAGDASEIDIVALDEALTRLAAIDGESARVVECRFFGGFRISETAEALNMSPATVKRRWLFARTWLRRELDAGTL
ncbi:MAG TPA: sigma-70 family RNA polymerase sigma factor [Sphingomonadaceae bacterium]|nr:sigma-70 family RNA polymerase sigma factor [Sphingomonadaceae bacterium]